MRHQDSAHWPSTGRPIAPASSAWRTRCAAGHQRRWKMTPSETPHSRAAAIIASASARLTVIGFSTMGCLPACAAAIASAACDGCGVAIDTSSISGSAKT